MTTIDGECCGNCDAFMPDRFNSDQGACSVIDDECIAYASYHWVTIDGDCLAWRPRKVLEHEVKLLYGQMVLEWMNAEHYEPNPDCSAMLHETIRKLFDECIDTAKDMVEKEEGGYIG